MGAAIAQRLISLGHELAVWNRTAEKTRPLAALGAKTAVTPSQLAASSEAIITILTDAAPIDAGASMKLAINLPLLVFWQAFGEALALCRSLGLDSARIVDIFADTSGGPNVLKGRGAVLAAALQGKDTGPITVDIDAMRKDLRTMVEEAGSLGKQLPVTSRALECYEEASREGLGKSDITAIPVRWMKKPGKTDRKSTRLNSSHVEISY